MSVIFRFIRDPEKLRAGSEDPTVAEGWELEVLLLHQQVDLIIDDVTITTGHSIPLLFLTKFCLDQLRLLPSLRIATLEIPADNAKYDRLFLHLEMQNDHVSVRERSFGKASATVPYEQLLTAWERFADEAKAYLLSEFPDLRIHPEVGGWFD